MVEVSERMSWLRTGADTVGTRAAAALGWGGVALPATTLLGCRIIAVAELDLDVHRRRHAAGDGPQLDSDILAMWEWPEAAACAPHPALRLVGVLLRARGGWRAALSEARTWRGFGPAAVLAAPDVLADEICRLEFSVHGIGLAPDDGDCAGGATVAEAEIIWAEPGRCASARRRTADRWVEEFLYRHALQHGYFSPG